MECHENTDIQQQHKSPKSTVKASMHEKSNPNSKDHDDVISPAPDGGYAWVILACSFYTNFCIDGIVGSFGLLLPLLMEEFKATAAVTSMLSSTLIGIFLIIGYITSFLVERYGTQRVMLSGACMYTLGLFLSFFAPSILVLFLTYGLLCGFGIGLVFLPSVMIVNQYFDRKRSLANGILTSGSGIGLLVMASVTEKSIEAFGWRGSLLICASFTMQLCVCASLMRPIGRMKRKDKYHEDSTSPLCEKGFDQGNDDIRYTSMPFLNRNLDLACGSTSSLPVLFLTNLSSEKELPLKETVAICNKENRMQNTEVNGSKSCTLPAFVYSKPFCFLCIGCVLTQMGQFIPLVYIGDYGNHVGVTSADISIVLSTFGECAIWCLMDIHLPYSVHHFLVYSTSVANTTGRLFAGFIANTRCLGHLNICNIGLIISAVACFLFFLCKTFGALLGFAVAYGFFIGFFPPMQPLMILDCVGLEQLTAAYGFVTMLKSPAAIIGPPLAGALLELTGKYEVVNGLAGVIFTIAACAQMFALCWSLPGQKLAKEIDLDV